MHERTEKRIQKTATKVVVGVLVHGPPEAGRHWRLPRRYWAVLFSLGWTRWRSTQPAEPPTPPPPVVLQEGGGSPILASLACGPHYDPKSGGPTCDRTVAACCRAHHHCRVPGGGPSGALAGALGPPGPPAAAKDPVPTIGPGPSRAPLCPGPPWPGTA